MRTFYELPRHAVTTMAYAGIGNRDIEGIRDPGSGKPLHSVMRWVAGELERLGYVLHSGGAKGSDQAFESGVVSPAHKRIFLASDATDETRAIARELHPLKERLSGYALDLFARNTNQVFGTGLDMVVDFVLCYTRDGCDSFLDRTRETGGTGQAIEMATRKGAACFNMKNDGWLDQLNSYLKFTGIVAEGSELRIPGDLT